MRIFRSYALEKQTSDLLVHFSLHLPFTLIAPFSLKLRSVCVSIILLLINRILSALGTEETEHNDQDEEQIITGRASIAAKGKETLQDVISNSSESSESEGSPSGKSKLDQPFLITAEL